MASAMWPIVRLWQHSANVLLFIMIYWLSQTTRQMISVGYLLNKFRLARLLVPIAMVLNFSFNHHSHFGCVEKPSLQ